MSLCYKKSHNIHSRTVVNRFIYEEAIKIYWFYSITIFKFVWLYNLWLNHSFEIIYESQDSILSV